MIRLVTDYLEESAKKYKDKAAVTDETREITFGEVRKEAYCVAGELIRREIFKKPVAVFLDKSVECIPAFMGAAYSGNFYTPLDTKMPASRIEKIMTTLHPAAVITDEAHREAVKEFAADSEILVYEEMQKADMDEKLVQNVTDRVIDTDVLYVLFTSGSTGTPKGVIISQRALIDFVEWSAEKFQIDETIILGNQTPFYFSMSVFDIYQCLRNGATMHIIPHKIFSFPGLLMQYLFDRKVNTLFWVPSALSLVATFHALSSPHLPELRNVFFGGEVMPVKQLNMWREEYPDAVYVNFYGPTEAADTCTAYTVNREFDKSERLPMGDACRNTDVFLLTEDDRLAGEGEIGEVCVRGCGLAYGYYNDPEKTNEVFVQNPLNPYYREMIYRTGDLAQYNEYGELVYMSRKDFQIKHMGHRIELGEIETAVSAIEGVEANCCLYDSEKSRIVMFYTGKADEHEVMEKIKEAVPAYMVPNRKYHLDVMPYNLNGKIDRQKLKEMMKVRKK